MHAYACRTRFEEGEGGLKDQLKLSHVNTYTDMTCTHNRYAFARMRMHAHILPGLGKEGEASGRVKEGVEGVGEGGEMVRDLEVWVMEVGVEGWGV